MGRVEHVGNEGTAFVILGRALRQTQPRAGFCRDVRRNLSAINFKLTHYRLPMGDESFY